jgi:hypothetical protein
MDAVSSAWVRYTALRLGLFLGLVVLFVLLGIVVWLAAVLAAIISLCLSYIFLANQRHAIAADLAARRTSKEPPGADETAEDAALGGPAGGRPLEGEGGGETEPEEQRREGGQL